MSRRPKRSTHRPNYKFLADIELPKAKRSCTKKDKLYAVTIVGRQGTKLKVHYVGYGSQYDEWRDKADIVPLDRSKKSDADAERDCNPVPRPFSLYSELRNKIKMEEKNHLSFVLTCHLINYSSMVVLNSMVRLSVPFEE